MLYISGYTRYHGDIIIRDGCVKFDYPDSWKKPMVDTYINYQFFVTDSTTGVEKEYSPWDIKGKGIFGVYYIENNEPTTSMPNKHNFYVFMLNKELIEISELITYTGFEFADSSLVDNIDFDSLSHIGLNGLYVEVGFINKLSIMEYIVKLVKGCHTNMYKMVDDKFYILSLCNFTMENPKSTCCYHEYTISNITRFKILLSAIKLRG